jgi:hypothetical protein
MVLVRTVHGRAGGKFGRAAFLSGRGRSRKSAGLAPAAFAARTTTAASMSTAAATSPAAASLAAFTALATLHTISAHLTLSFTLALLAARLDACARLATG